MEGSAFSITVMTKVIYLLGEILSTEIPLLPLQLSIKVGVLPFRSTNTPELTTRAPWVREWRCTSYIPNNLHGISNSAFYIQPFLANTLQIGWKPAPTQPEPLERGTGKVNLKDVL